MEAQPAENPIQLEAPARVAADNATSAAVHKWVVLAIVLSFFYLNDAALAGLFQKSIIGDHLLSSLFGAILIGICIGQLSLISMWAAIGPGKIVWRLPWTMLLGVLTWYSMVLGCRFVERDFPIENAIEVGLVLLAGILIGQVPLWIAGKRFGWRLQGWRPAGSANISAATRYGLKHVMIGMLLLSLAMAPARAVLPAGEPKDINFESQLLVFFFALVICNLIICVPCIWRAFAGSRSRGPFLIIWPAYCATVTLVEIGGLSIVLGPPHEDELFEVLLVFYCVNLSQCLTVYLTLLIFKGLGCRLTRADRGVVRLPWHDAPPS